jgi:hypothetical protein
MSDTIRFIDLAKKLGVGIDTIRRTVAKLGDDLGIVVQRESHSSRAQCLSVDDADKLIRYFEERDKHVAATSPGETSTSYSNYGYFYIIQLLPELFPERVKIGYTDNLETRLREHQTAAPTARYLKSWECKRSWEQAVADSITRKDCKLVMNEVYEGNLELLVQRADELFLLMPNNNTTVELSEHSPLRAKKTTPTVNPANPSR